MSIDVAENSFKLEKEIQITELLSQTTNLTSSADDTHCQNSIHNLKTVNPTIVVLDVKGKQNLNVNNEHLNNTVHPNILMQGSIQENVSNIEEKRNPIILLIDEEGDEDTFTSTNCDTGEPTNYTDRKSINIDLKQEDEYSKNKSTLRQSPSTSFETSQVISPSSASYHPQTSMLITSETLISTDSYPHYQSLTALTPSETLHAMSTPSNNENYSIESIDSNVIITEESSPPEYNKLYPTSNKNDSKVGTSIEKLDEAIETCESDKFLKAGYENHGYNNQDLLEANRVCGKTKPSIINTMKLGTVSVTIDIPLDSPGGLPTYKSLGEYLLLDAPPNYEIVTGKKVEYDQVFIPETVKSRSRSNTNMVPMTFGRKIFLIVILAVIGIVTIVLVAAQQLTS